jgi:hypothetical protein
MRLQETSKKDRAIAKKYLFELGLSLSLYVIILFGSIYFAKNMEAGWMRTLIVMTPTIPGFGALLAIKRSMARMDDYLRSRLLETIALSGGITAFFSFSYGFLEGIGYQKLSGFTNYGIFMVSWLVLGFARSLMEREK